MQVLSPGLTGIIFLTCFFSTARLLFLFDHVLYLNATLSFQLFILFCLCVCVCVCVCVFFSVNNQLRQNTFDRRLRFSIWLFCCVRLTTSTHDIDFKFSGVKECDKTRLENVKLGHVMLTATVALRV